MRLNIIRKWKILLSVVAATFLLLNIKRDWFNTNGMSRQAKTTKINMNIRRSETRVHRPAQGDFSKLILRPRHRPDEVSREILYKQQEVSEAVLQNLPKETYPNVNEGSTTRDKDKDNEDLHPYRCPNGYFRLPGMADCHPWLNCSNLKTDITSITSLKTQHSHAKNISLGQWKDHQVVISTIKPSHYRYASVAIIKEFQPSTYIVQLVGSCNYTYITQYHPYGDALSINRVLKLPNLVSRNNLKTRLQMCVSYIEAINFLHTRPDGPRVFCDSPTLLHTLSQFLITNDLHLVLADLDFMFHADSTRNITTNCYPLGLSKYFSSPEGLTKAREIDERSDVWKIPDVCDHFIGSWNTSIVSNELSNTRSRCKEKDPSRRPTSGEVLAVYKHVLYDVMNRT